MRVFLVIVSFFLSAHLLVVCSYNLVQLSAEELVEKSPFEELKEKELDQTFNLVFSYLPDFGNAIDFSAAHYSFLKNTNYLGIEREIPIPPPDFIYSFS